MKFRTLNNEEVWLDKNSRIYISGQITGNDNYVEDFKEVEDSLRKSGLVKIFNPTILPAIFSYEEYLAIDLTALKMCDAICLIGKNWEKSRGAICELDSAIKNRMYVMIADES